MGNRPVEDVMTTSVSFHRVLCIRTLIFGNSPEPTFCNFPHAEKPPKTQIAIALFVVGWLSEDSKVFGGVFDIFWFCAIQFAVLEENIVLLLVVELQFTCSF